MLGLDKKASSTRNKDGGSSSRSRKKSSKNKVILKKKVSGKEGLVVSKSGKIKITSVEPNQKLY